MSPKSPHASSDYRNANARSWAWSSPANRTKMQARSLPELVRMAMEAS